MKLGWILPLAVLFGLIAAPDAAFSAASDAALLWWTRVLPSLLPYLIASSLLERSGLFSRLPKRIAPFALLFFGALGGYPVGARLAGRLYRDGMLSIHDAQKTAALINLTNPVFLLSVVAAGLFSDPRAAAPLLLGIYGTALLGCIPLSHIHLQTVNLPAQKHTASELPDAIFDGVRAILVILGCMVFASVLGALFETTGLLSVFDSAKPVARAVMQGLFELTTGAASIAVLPLSLPLRLSLVAFFVQFGGLSVILQTASALPISALRYCFVRLLTALIAALAVWLLTPLFCPDTPVPTMASGAQMLQSTTDLLLVTLSAAFGLLLIFLFTFVLPNRQSLYSE
jgi:hypothetical protein